MTTRLDLRSRIRTTLTDTSGSPLWSDGTLNDALITAMSEYSVMNPKREVTLVAILATTTIYALPAGVDPLGCRALFDVYGRRIPRAAGSPGHRPPDEWNALLEWEILGEELRLTAEPGDSAGSWSLHHLKPRTMPTDDVTAVDVPSRDDQTLVFLAAAAAIELRQTDELKRDPAERSTFHTAEHIKRFRTRARTHFRRGYVTVTGMATE